MKKEKKNLIIASIVLVITFVVVSVGVGYCIKGNSQEIEARKELDKELELPEYNIHVVQVDPPVGSASNVGLK